MKGRTLTIRLQADWKAALGRAGARAKARSYQGEVLNFESPAAFFGRLTGLRWELVRTLQGQGHGSHRYGAAPGCLRLGRARGRKLPCHARQKSNF
jgi:hypothetical protein